MTHDSIQDPPSASPSMKDSHDIIIKKLDELKHALKIHHDTHGGSIKLGKAFHEVGHEMMNGLGLVPKHRRQDTSDSPIRSLKFGEMEIS